MRLKRLFKNHLLTGSFIVFLGNGIAGFFNYLYHLICGKLLSPDQYGLLQSLIALTYFLGIFTGAFSFSVIHLINKVKKSFVFPTIIKLEKEALKLSIIFWLLFLILFSVLKPLLHLKNFFIYFIFTLQIFFSFLPVVYLSLLRAKLEFFKFSLIGIFHPLAKDIFAIIFILASWQTAGALGGIVASGLVITLLARFWVLGSWQKVSKNLIKKISLDAHFWRYSSLSLITNLSLTSIYSTDILLVRHYLSAYQSGIYSATSVLGKIIFFAATSILLVSFPLFVKLKKEKDKLREVFWLSLLFLIIVCMFGAVGFTLFPKFVVSLLYDSGYQEAALFLPVFAIFISFFAFLNLMIQFLLAVEEEIVAVIGGIVAVSQTLLIIARHTNLKMIIINSIISVSAGLFLGLLSAFKVLYEKKD